MELIVNMLVGRDCAETDVNEKFPKALENSVRTKLCLRNSDSVLININYPKTCPECSSDDIVSPPDGGNLCMNCGAFWSFGNKEK